jgi:hypothetical protein
MTEIEFDVLQLGLSPFKHKLLELEQLFAPSVYPYPADLGNFSRWWWETMRIGTTAGSASLGKDQAVMGLGHCAVRCLARLLVSGGTDQVYTYQFSHPTQHTVNEMNVGVPLTSTHPGSVLVPHASELPYVFAAMHAFDNDAKEISLARNMSGQWLQFSNTGHPNLPGLPHWPKYDVSGDTTMVMKIAPIGTMPMQGLYNLQCDFLDRQSLTVCPALGQPSTVYV